MKAFALIALLVAGAAMARAEGFTTAAEVRPLLDMTRPDWVTIRDHDGQDLVYFAHLLAWRCGLSEIRYGLNGAPPTEVFAMEPCHENTAQPNEITSDRVHIAQPAGSVRSVTVRLIYDDGKTQEAVFKRDAVLMR